MELQERINNIEYLDYVTYRQTLIDMIEAVCGPLLSVRYDMISTHNLRTLASHIMNKHIPERI